MEPARAAAAWRGADWLSPRTVNGTHCAPCSAAIKDTVCGVNPLVNLFYLQILMLSSITLGLLGVYLVCFHSRNQSHFKKRLFFALLFTALGLTSEVLKCTDIFVDYRPTVYHLFENEFILIMVGIGIYLTIWSKMYRQISLHLRCKRALLCLEVLTFVLMAGYFVLSLLLVWYEDTSMGIHNPLQYYTALYLTYLLVCFNAVGFSLLLHIRSISANIYTSSRREITLNILCNCAFLTTRLVIEYLLLFGKPMFQRFIARTCELKGDNTWAFVNLVIEGSLVCSVLVYVLFLILTGLKHNRTREQSEDFSYMRIMHHETVAPPSGTNTVYLQQQDGAGRKEDDEDSFTQLAKVPI